MQRVLDQLVISMILALVRESDPPARAAPHIVARNNFNMPCKSLRLDSLDGDNLACRWRCPCFQHQLA